jgi:ABC-2 type transport system permease protein
LKAMNIVLRRDFRELRQTNAFRIVAAASGAITIAGAAGISIALGRQEWLEQQAACSILETVLGLVVYFLPLLVLITFIWAFASLPITKEKVNGNIECLLATPLSPKAVWIGKSLAVFLPGYIISVAGTLIVLLAVNLGVILPATGELVLPAPVLLTGFLVNPLLFFALLLFIVLFSLAGSPDIAIGPSFLLGFGLMIGIPVALTTGALDLASWSFTLWYFTGTAVAWIIVLYLSRLLTKEKIVLSSKGE